MKLLAKKSLGQNFLHAPHVVGAMVSASLIDDKSIVFEIGPGTGILTKALLATGARVVAIEKDDRAVPLLAENFRQEIESGKLELIHGDVLEMVGDKEKMLSYGLADKKYVLVANIPYYITGELLRLTLESDIQPSRAVVMVEKNVADRIIARDGKESILSISVKAYGTPTVVCKVPKRFFRPVPSVDSAVIMIGDTGGTGSISKDFFDSNGLTEREFFDVVRLGFAHKRKILLGNLGRDQKLLNLWENEGWSPKIRAEELTLKDWAKIAIVFHKKTL